jgi:N4-gp56 family major capsid protein
MFEEVKSSFTKRKLSDYLLKKETAALHDFPVSVKLADTTTATTGIATSTPATKGVTGIVWATEIIKYAEGLKRFDQAVMQNEYMVNYGADSVMIPRMTSELEVDFSPGGGEGTARDGTEVNNISTVSVRIGTSDWKLGKLRVSKQTAMTTMVDMLENVQYQAARALAQDVDVSIASMLMDTSVTNVVYGGDATQVDHLTTGDVITPGLISDAKTKLAANNYVARMVFLSPELVGQLRKDPQFVNASQYGSNDVVLKGEVENYLGIRIIETTNTPAFVSGATDTNESSRTWGANGHCGIMVGTNGEQGGDLLVAGVLAWKEKPQIDYEYKKDEALHCFYLNQAYKAQILEPKAVCLIKVADQ